jgi:hypothetical protein
LRLAHVFIPFAVLIFRSFSAPGHSKLARSLSDIPRPVKIMQELLLWERSQVRNIHDFYAMAKVIREELRSVYNEPLRKRFLEKCKRRLHIFQPLD